MMERTAGIRRRDPRRGTAGLRGTYLGLRGCGLSVEQAANLTARLEGVHPVPGGWSMPELERLRFMRWLVAAGRIGADDRLDVRRRRFSLAR